MVLINQMPRPKPFLFSFNTVDRNVCNTCIHKLPDNCQTETPKIDNIGLVSRWSAFCWVALSAAIDTQAASSQSQRHDVPTRPPRGAPVGRLGRPPRSVDARSRGASAACFRCVRSEDGRERSRLCRGRRDCRGRGCGGRRRHRGRRQDVVGRLVLLGIERLGRRLPRAAAGRGRAVLRRAHGRSAEPVCTMLRPEMERATCAVTDG